jgi:hypothetical protein
MCANELDVQRPKTVGNSDHQSVIIAFDVENHLIVSNETGLCIPKLDVLRTFPLCMTGIFKPGLKRLF